MSSFEHRSRSSMTAKTKEKPRTTETVERELEEVRSAVARMRSELAELSEPPQIGWDGVSPETLSRVAEADSKRAALPAAIEDGERRILELELELVRLRRPGAKAKIEEVYADWQDEEETASKAAERAREKNHAWLEALRHEKNLMLEERRLTEEIAKHKAQADNSRERLAAPVVRSVWQQRTKDAHPGWWKW
jgi:hypothetical protein